MTAELTPESVAPLLSSQGLLALTDPLTLTPLSGGVSNDVVLVESPKGRWVVKRALERLKVKTEWKADVRRILREADVLEYLAARLEPGAVPRLVARDDARFLIAMEAVHAGARNWKAMLMAGEAHPAVAGRAGALLGQIHQKSAGDGEAHRRFGDAANFEELRIDPYFRAAARVRPECAAGLDKLVRLTHARAVCLVHGDYSPKNMLVAEGLITLLDHEVAHWGDPAFDVGFCVNHFLLKALRFPDRAESFLALVPAFLQGYRSQASPDFAGVTLQDTPLMLGGLLLARVDGKSPAEYLTTRPQKDAVRCVARRALEGSLGTIDKILDAVRQEVELLAAAPETQRPR